MRLRIESAETFPEPIPSAIDIAMRKVLELLSDTKFTPAQIKAAISPLVPRARSQETKVANVKQAFVKTLEGITVSQIGANSSFFDLGGASVLLPVLQKELANFGASISIIDLFDAETVEGIAERAVFELKVAA